MPDITSDFISRLQTNGRQARVMGLSATVTGLAGLAALHTWFYYKVRNHGDWDLKNNVYKKYKPTGIEIAGRHYENDMPGNYHYGFVGTAAGFPATELYWAAGEAQKRAGTSRPDFYCTFGDEPEDNEFIRLGVKLYTDYELDFTAKELKKNLDEFVLPVCPPSLPLSIPGH